MKGTFMELLEQTEWWVTRDGREMTVPEMDTGHLTNLYAFLMKRALVLHMVAVFDAVGWIGTANGEMAQYYLEGELIQLENTDPEDWMRERPLMIAITEEISRREKTS